VKHYQRPFSRKNLRVFANLNYIYREQKIYTSQSLCGEMVFYHLPCPQMAIRNHEQSGIQSVCSTQRRQPDKQNCHAAKIQLAQKNDPQSLFGDMYEPLEISNGRRR
jgi:hypothetical protein